MTIVSAQEYQSVFSELQCLKEKFVALEQELTFVGRSSPNPYRKVRNTTTQRVGITRGATRSNYRVVATTRSEYSRDC